MFIQVSILRNNIYLATALGADFHELCRRVKISEEQLNNGEGYFPWEAGEDHNFWNQALKMTGDPCLGLHMGQKNNNSFGMLGLLSTSCKNIKEAMEMVCKYNDTVTSVIRFSLDLSGNDAIFSFNPHPIWEQTNLEGARQAVDMNISSWIKGFLDATGKKIQPIQTELRYPKRFLEEYRQILKTPVLFDRPSNCFVLSKDDIHTPLVGRDQSLFTVLNALMLKKQDQLKASQTLGTQIKYLLLSVFNGQITHIDIVASRLSITTRTLQRKLTEEKTSYRKICSELRKELTHDLLKAGKSKKIEIASLLGYADVSTFSKALKSWKIKER